jgi:hypothetical protein
MLDEQFRQRDNSYYGICCDECCESGHVISVHHPDGRVEVRDSTAEIKKGEQRQRKANNTIH